jgi:hypothetical protein
MSGSRGDPGNDVSRTTRLVNDFSSVLTDRLGPFLALRSSMIAVLLMFIALTALAAAPAWPYSRRWGYAPAGTLSVTLLILMLLVIAGRI